MSVHSSKTFWKTLIVLLFLALTVVLVAQQQASRPSLNDFWKGKDTEPLVNRLEEENREIYRERATLAAVAGPRLGSVIADVGAGSGFMVEEFSKLVGPEGKVYASRINLIS